MKSKIRFAAAALAAIVALALIFGLSIRSVSEPQTDITVSDEQLVPLADDSYGLPQEQSPLDFGDQPAATAGFSEAVAAVELEELDFNSVRDVQIVGNELLLATAGGLVSYLPADSSFSVYSFPQGIADYDCYALLEHDQVVLLGTSGGVYCVDSYGDVARLWQEIDDTVTTIEHVNDRYLVGTARCGLFEITDDLIEAILPDKGIIAVTENEFGLWAATREDGLLSFDGEKWRKRFLLADTTAFAQTTSLESAYQRLWVGTERGLYRFDGGNWELLPVGDEGYSNNVTGLARGRGFIYIGTEGAGVWAYYVFDGSLEPLSWSEHLDVTALDYSAGRFLVGTDTEGAVFQTPRRRLDIHDIFKIEDRYANTW